MAIHSLPQVSTHHHTERAPRLLNIATAGGCWYVELEGTGRKRVTPDVGRAMLASARRERQVARVHHWGAWTTWHLLGGAS